MTIKILPQAIANQIAAGEVVERPSSVIKECIENSIDAQAQNIEIYIEKGGKKLIEIRDDGVGMSAEDAEKCIKRHATSKIQKIEDLFAIQSFGFRGEALAAISSVSRFTLCTKTKKDKLGIKIKIESGKILEKKEISADNGTTVIISDLFFSIPARLQYLKSENTEYRQIVKEIQNFAIANPSVNFSLYKEKKLILDFGPAKDKKSRINKILPKEIQNLCEVDYQNLGIKISGFISHPKNFIKNRNYQFIFVNNRKIENSKLNFVIRQALIESVGIEKHLHPVFILFITLDPILVDVNVHPQKLEVKFAEPYEVFGVVKKSIQNSLEKYFESLGFKNNQSSRSIYESESRREIHELSYEGGDIPVDKFMNLPKEFNFFTENQKKHESNYKTNFLKNNSTENKSTNFSSNQKFYPSEKQASQKKLQESFDAQKKFFSKSNSKGIYEILHEKKFDFEIQQFTLIGQVAQKYIMAQTDEGIFLFDQHALHERQLFETFFEEIKNKKISIQKLLLPENLLLTEVEISVLKEHEKFIKNLGFSFNFKKNNLIISEVPQIIDKQNLMEFFLDFVSYFENEKIAEHSVEKFLRKILEYKSCRQAIKFGKKLSTEEMQHLLENFFSTKWRLSCPHGRPNYVFWSFDEINKKFHRG